MEYDPNDEVHQSIMENLVLEGAAILDGVDENGEPHYVFDMDILEEVSPELHAAMQEEVDLVLLDLYQKNLIDVTYDENLNAVLIYSEQGKVALLELGFNLDESEEII